MEQQMAFQINFRDNVATALTELNKGPVVLRGDSLQNVVDVKEHVLVGHKIALRDIDYDEDIIKYGIVIGRATQSIAKGKWVHLHCMRSIYDERSSHLDIVTGKPKDIKYE
ncbi:UxaA family hydrolase [Marinisporobacter balticus]|uniref:Altronate dehydratase small subunit n=1 Tax=Marinisporobacter balticus TaxID=2018667 RepID=A0A4V2S9Q6_9FIRM|nr:UxaA family hydrolase [Marinisporobacter balticus]TCO68810.1 altronate dehydratase small subunit [Marinisporobacter balticus]